MSKIALKKGKLIWILNYKPEEGFYQTIRGRENGKLITGTWQEGNDRKIESLINIKRKHGYSETGEIVEQFSCMLGESIKKRLPVYPVIVDYKFDGARLLITKDGIFTKDSLGHLSRKITYLTTMEKQLNIIRKILTRYLKTDNFVLDGELYNHEIGFDGSSAMLKFNPDRQEIDEKWIAQKDAIAKYSQFYWYDIAINGYDLLERIAIRDKIYKYFAANTNHDRIYNVPYWTSNNPEETDTLFEKAVSEGYEGLMLKNPKGYYEQRRTSNIIKYKKKEDMEVTVVEVIEGNGERKSVMGRLIVEYEFNNKIINQSIDLRSNGVVQLNRELLKYILENKEAIIGSKMTVEFMELTKNGKMKLGKGLVDSINIKAIRDYE